MAGRRRQQPRSGRECVYTSEVDEYNRTMTYRAFYQDDHSCILFRGKQAADVRGLLPRGARVCPDLYNTIGRTDGGDEFERAIFEVDGRKIMVIADPGQK